MFEKYLTGGYRGVTFPRKVFFFFAVVYLLSFKSKIKNSWIAAITTHQNLICELSKSSEIIGLASSLVLLIVVNSK